MIEKKIYRHEGQSGPEYLAYAIMERAVEDYKALQGAGIIVKGKVVDKWPVKNGKPLKKVGLSRRFEAVQLVHTLEKEFDRLLDGLGSSLNGSEILAGLERGEI